MSAGWIAIGQRNHEHDKQKVQLIEQQRLRFFEIMRRHVREEDGNLTDLELVRAVYERWERSLSDALIDPNE